MNPFSNTENQTSGTKKDFYFSQLDSIEAGFNNAKKINVKGKLQTCRMYISLYSQSRGVKLKTRVDDSGDLWVAILEAE